MLLPSLNKARASQTRDQATVQMLKGIDTLQQMQDKRSSYTADSHYDINTTNTSIITKDAINKKR